MTSQDDNTHRVTILNIPIDRIDLLGVVARCREWLRGNEGHQIATVNPEFIMAAQRNVEFAQALRATALNVADGVGLVYASRFLSGKQNELTRVTGVELTWKLVGLCADTGAALYLMGEAPGVAEKVSAIMKEKYPTLNIVGAEEGIPKESADYQMALESLLGRIYVAKPAVLLVALGAPKQDLWIAEHLSKFPTIKIAMGVGGTFNYIAGIVPYAPQWMRAAGLEWLYRLITQPRRLNRIVTATVRFPIAVLLSTIRK